MNKAAKIITVFLGGMTMLSSCTDIKSSSPFAEILSQPTFAAITDSIKKEPKNEEILFRRAILLNQNNFPEPALADFQKAWSLKKDERFALGISTLLLNKKPDSAILFIQEALKELPASRLLQLSLARAYEAQNKPDEALTICNDILHENSERVDVLKMKAELLEKKGNTKESVNTLETAYRIAPFDIDLNYALAFKYAENKNVAVVRLCDSLINKDSLHHHAEPYYYKGIYYSNINDKEKALGLFEQAIQHDLYYLNAYIEKGRVLYDQKQYIGALKTFRLVNAISATFPDAYFWMGKCQEAIGQREEAKLNYQRAYALDKTFTEAKDAADKIVN